MTQPLTPPPTDGVLATEPVAAFLAGLAGIVDIGIVVANALDWLQLTDGQAAAIIAFVTGASAFIASVLRAKVYSPATVAALVAPIAPDAGPL